MTNIRKLKYPIGRFRKKTDATPEMVRDWVKEISTFPDKLINEVIDLTEEQLDARYRPEGWTIRQVIHHCADSHMNSFIRLKLALTEDRPVVKPYYENLWAELEDSTEMPIDSSLKILEGVHARWAKLLNNLTEAQLSKVFIHPEHGTCITIKHDLVTYAWHGNHHLAHIKEGKKRNNWL